MESQLVGGIQPPFWEQQTDALANFHYNHTSWPPIVGMVGVTNFRGAFAVPNQLAIVDRNTFDTIVNAGITPMFRLGSARFVLTPGLQFTIRRDTLTPVQINQNLFRQYLYLNSSPLFQWLQIQGSAIHDAGPFTEQNLSSRDLIGSLQFRVGRPWGNTAMITGYSVRDLLYHPLISEYFTTSAWGGLEHRFGQKTTVTALAQYIRSWRVLNNQFAFAQILVPGARVDYKRNDNWSAYATFNYTQGEGFHAYDNVQSGVFISYVRPIRRSVTDSAGALQVDYPLRFSAGVQQETFYNFSAGTAQTSVWRPVIQISIF
jgi:hypothetical protein